MSKAMQALKDFLTASPSVVYPDEVLELLQPVDRENAKLKRKLEILKAHGIEIVDAVAGGFEIYNKEHARADRLQVENANLREMLSESRQANEHLYVELKRYKRIFRTRPIDVNALFYENKKLRELATLMRTFHVSSCNSCRWHDECKERTDWKCIAPQKIDSMADELGIKPESQVGIEVDS